jgi:[protein-PII] uridylyltransferase
MSPANVSASDFYSVQFARIRKTFESTGDGRAAAAERSGLASAVVTQLYQAHISRDTSGPHDFCLCALGGFGRSELFPHSDVDILFLSETSGGLAEHREAVAAISRTLWDMGLRASTTSRTLAECAQLHRDNLEFSISLLDGRYLAGDAYLFTHLREQALPHLVARDRAELVQRLVEMTEARHQKHGDTIFHLEPNIKEAPGGMRDYHVARWLAMIFVLEQGANWKHPEELWPKVSAEEADRAYAFLSSTRAFLHYRRERDDNHLTYELQDEAAAAGIGSASSATITADEWMRNYFRQARTIDRLLAEIIEEAAPPRSSLYGLFQDWRSRFSTPDFSVVRGKIFLRQPPGGSAGTKTLLDLFEFAARHGLELSREAERWTKEAILHFDAGKLEPGALWNCLRHILVAPRSWEALRSMHRLGVLDTLFPEFRAIDSLVVRDYYHRYTVDAHSLLTLENLSRLPAAERGAQLQDWEKRFSAIYQELDQPELLLFAMLFHDVGKGISPGAHVRGSLEAVAGIFERLGVSAEDGETVRFLIQNHLEMSATLQRRDIFDPQVVRVFSENVGTTERLKMLTLLTYADVKSVNPDALTPWKAEMLWQIYAAATNYLTRSLDQERVHAGVETTMAPRVLSLLAGRGNDGKLDTFLEGFPRRYLLTHSPEEIAAHFEMYCRFDKDPVGLSLRDREHFFELTVTTRDRPFLFASIAGTLTAWGMNILKADAYSNSAGVVLDTFRFTDLHRTIELNPSERGRFLQSITDALSGKTSLEALLRSRVESSSPPRAKVRVPTQIRFEKPPAHPSGPARSTLLEVITQDRPGLLYQLSSTLAEMSLNIEVALIDTEGQKAIDVFYLTSRGAQLDPSRQEAVRTELLKKFQGENTEGTSQDK